MIKSLNRLRRDPKLAIDYFVGNYRTYIYNNMPFLLRKHIKEQFEWRLEIMNQSCLDNGECIVCGCKTPNLQFANKSCEGSCYPPLVSRKLWKRIKESKNC